MNLAKIIKSLTGSAPRSSADLRADLQAIDLAALEQAVDKLENERRRLLLRGSDAELKANADSITAANLECERGGAVVEELKKLIASAEVSEQSAAIEAQAEAAQRERANLVKIYAEVEQHAAKLKELFADASSSCAILAKWNARAEKIGQPNRRIEFLETAIVKRGLMKLAQ